MPETHLVQALLHPTEVGALIIPVSQMANSATAGISDMTKETMLAKEPWPQASGSRDYILQYQTTSFPSLKEEAELGVKL